MGTGLSVASGPPNSHLVVLDLGLPDLDGSDALRMLRGITDVPIIIATARDDEQSVVRLLRAGADDYMVKPFTGAHLDARITTVLRRAGRASRTVQPAVHTVGGLRVDVGERSAHLDGEPLALTRKEFDLLAYLAARPGRVVSRRELLEEVWRQPSVGEDQTIDVSPLCSAAKCGDVTRRKPRYLRTVRGSASGWCAGLRRSLALLTAGWAPDRIGVPIPLTIGLDDRGARRGPRRCGRRSALVTGALTVSTDADVVRRAVEATGGDLATRPLVRGLGTNESTGRASEADMQRARVDGRSLVVDVDGGLVRLDPVVLGDTTAVVEVFVPESALGGVSTTRWAMLLGVAAALVGAAVLVVDRVAVRAADAARGLSGGLQIRRRPGYASPGRPPRAGRGRERFTGWPTACRRRDRRAGQRRRL